LIYGIRGTEFQAHKNKPIIFCIATMTIFKILGPAWSRAFRCVWMLEELGIAYESVGNAMPATKRVLQYNKAGKIPVLLEYSSDSADESQPPDFVLSESVAINTYLADKYGQGLVPLAGTRERAVYDQVVCCILSELDAQGLWIHRKHAGPLTQYFGEIPEAAKAAEVQFTRVNKCVAAWLNPYILGEHFSAADILYVHCLDWSKALGWHESWPENIEPYRQLCHARPAYQRAKALRDSDKAELGTTKL
jgi:glutathione S-transferase